MTKSTASSMNELLAGLLIEELVRFGVERFVMSPGSRCTPLTAAVASHPRAQSTVHFDERGAAFYALGLARATGKPAALVCTSGTAAANYYPAIVEAAMDMLPMVVLTADRPAALRGTGANQTIDQVELYGTYPRRHVDLPCPKQSIPPERYLWVIDEVVTCLTMPPRGPVHINCQFDEPLAPLGDKQDFSSYLKPVEDWLNGAATYTKPPETDYSLSDKAADELLSTINGAESGLLVVGGLHNQGERAAAATLAKKLGWPVFADIRSGMRTGASDAGVIAYFDQLLLSETCRNMKIDTVLHLGGMVTSKRYHQWISGLELQHYIHIANHPYPHHPGRDVTQRVQGDIAYVCGRLAANLAKRENTSLLTRLRECDSVVESVLKEQLDANKVLTEPAIARLISKHLTSGSSLFLASSMPIRDTDMYAHPDAIPSIVTGNRGASGIDGSIATAAGLAAGTAKSVTAVIGDLALLHDLNSLALLKNEGVNVTLVVINNHGGGIFSFLPVAECADIFEPYFGTPHDLSFDKAASMFGLDYYSPDSPSAFVETYKKAQATGHATIIEITTDRTDNRAFHDLLQEKIRTALKKI